MEKSNKQIAALSSVGGLMILTSIIINRVGSGMYLELIQGFLAGLSVVISFMVIHKIATREKASQ